MATRTHEAARPQAPGISENAIMPLPIMADTPSEVALGGAMGGDGVAAVR